MEKKIGTFMKVETKRKRTSVKKQMNELLAKLSEMDPTDPRYEPTQKALMNLNSMDLNSKVSRAKIFSAIGGLGVMGGVAFMAYKIDDSDEIPRNKACLNLCGKLLGFILPKKID